MATPVENYVFPRSDLETFSIAQAERFKQMIEQGAPSLGIDGLLISPLFKHRTGTGGNRDKSLNQPAKVVFYDDGPQSVPYIMIVGIQEADREEWVDDQWIYPCTIALDCCAPVTFPEGISPGIDARNADAVLAGYVRSMVESYELLTTWGFTYPHVTPEAPPALNRDETPFVFHAGMTVSYEAYMSRV